MTTTAALPRIELPVTRTATRLTADILGRLHRASVESQAPSKSVPLRNVDSQRSHRMRWVILQAIHASQPFGCFADLILNVVQALYNDVTSSEILRELGALAGLSVIDVDERGGARWWAGLTHAGMRVVAYQVDSPQGIARPTRYLID